MFRDEGRGYRDDEEIYVYDQCCENCALHDCCPMDISETDTKATVRRKKRLQEEDAVRRDGEIVWCVNWKQKKRRRW